MPGRSQEKSFKIQSKRGDILRQGIIPCQSLIHKLDIFKSIPAQPPSVPAHLFLPLHQIFLPHPRQLTCVESPEAYTPPFKYNYLDSLYAVHDFPFLKRNAITQPAISAFVVSRDWRFSPFTQGVEYGNGKWEVVRGRLAAILD